MKETLQIAVRTLVAHVLSRGDLSYGFQTTARNVDAIRAHQKIQKSRPEGYQPEVSVSHETETDHLILRVSGRIDGVFTPLETESSRLYIEEIKTTTGDLERRGTEENPLHWGQAKVYGWMVAKELGLPDIDIHLTYYQLDSGAQLTVKRTFPAADLEAFFTDLVQRYLAWAETVADFQRLRNTSIQALDFPFPDYRPGQRNLAVNVYNAIRHGHQLLVQAPTGIGKTMATLFPAVKGIGQGVVAKVFYLTARTTARSVAEAALKTLAGSGLRIKGLTLTAKDKLCFEPDAACNGEECPFARGFYDRIRDAVDELFSSRDLLDRSAIEAAARKHRVCPFELSLTLSRWVDVIVCDYNYAFDPRVYLRHFFLEEPDRYVFLIDEAHNLVDRAREMFSADITKKPFLELRRSVKTDLPGLYRTLGRINTCLVTLRKRCEAARDDLSDPAPPEDLLPFLKDFIYKAENWLARNEPTPFREQLLELYFAVGGFVKISDQFDDSYVTCLEKSGADLRVKLFCMNPADHLASALTRCTAAVFFSATLAPADYFRHLLGCNDTAGVMALPSPFPEENLCLLTANRISTRYRHREKSLPAVTDAILAVIDSRPGNYLLFFPSYAYLEQFREELTPRLPDTRVLVQIQGMDERDRDRFLEEFSRPDTGTLVGLVVMGGIFGEGIDLVGERLSGAVVVGVGLPGICLENDLIRNYFARTCGRGFEYAYMYPGLNRVLQAAGRVIRSETDRGVILLIDERFDTARYRSLLPTHWRPRQMKTPDMIRSAVKCFWGNNTSDDSL